MLQTGLLKSPFRRLLILLTVAALLAPFILSQRKSLRGEAFIDRDYIFALAGANSFLAAWQDRDHAKGLGLVTPSLRRKHGEEYLRRWLLGTANPINASFEVGPGHRLSDGRFAFDVQLYTYRRGELIEPRRLRPEPSQIVLVQIGPEDWLVDELP